MESLKFLQEVWGERHGWVDIPSKTNGHWIPWYAEWPNAEGEIDTRIKAATEDGEDVYFSAALFASRGRRLADAEACEWLWADLDEVTPEACAAVGYPPTLCWESSPGRYQALWQMDRFVLPAPLEALNRALTHRLGADPGGYDLTQVLRVPGTRNFKYPDAPSVALVWESDEVYDPRDLWRQLGPQSSVRSSIARGGRGAAKLKVPARARALLRVKPGDESGAGVVAGERSARLWELECLLIEAGWTDEQVARVVGDSVWNKWKDVSTGDSRLRADIRKARRHVEKQARTRPPLGASGIGGRKEATVVDINAARNQTKREVPPEPETVQETVRGRKRQQSAFIDYARFLSTNFEAPRWLVENIWGANSHGIFGGEPKTSKSTFTLALALSVASGKPFLGKFPVKTTGGVLLVQEENDPWQVQDRLRKIARFYKLIKARDTEVIPRGGAGGPTKGEILKERVRLAFPDELPLHFLNNYGFDMLLDEHRQLLEEEIRSVQPKLIILDPLYLMVGGADTDKSHHVVPFFKWLLYLRYTYNCAVVVVHHFRKATGNGPPVRPGQRLLGSATFHGWIDSALYFENRTTDLDRSGVMKVRVEREFRSVGQRKPLDIRLTMGPPGTLDFNAEVEQYDISGELRMLVHEQPGLSVATLGEQLGLDKRTLLGRAHSTDGIEVVNLGSGRGRGKRLYPTGHPDLERGGTGGGVVDTDADTSDSGEAEGGETSE